VKLKVVGKGPDVLLVHGSATDRSTWAIQLASHAGSLRMWAPTRPGADGAVTSVAEQAEALRGALAAEGVTRFVCVGSSFGAIVCLELARLTPLAVRGAVLIEPPMSVSDSVPAVPDGFGCRFDAMAATRGGEAAAEMFLRLVLGEGVFERIPAAFRARSVASWKHIRADSVALARYRPRYPALREVQTPMLLVGGEKSPPVYGDILAALAAVLPRSRRETVPRAGHMLHAEAPRVFGRLLLDFVADLPA